MLRFWAEVVTYIVETQRQWAEAYFRNADQALDVLWDLTNKRLPQVLEDWVHDAWQDLVEAEALEETLPGWESVV